MNPFMSSFSFDVQIFVHNLVQRQESGIENDNRLWLNLKSMLPNKYEIRVRKLLNVITYLLGRLHILY